MNISRMDTSVLQAVPYHYAQNTKTLFYSAEQSKTSLMSIV